MSTDYSFVVIHALCRQIQVTESRRAYWEESHRISELARRSEFQKRLREMKRADDAERACRDLRQQLTEAAS